MSVHVHVSVFLISPSGIPLALRASYLALQSSLFEPDGTVKYDYIVTNSINSLLIVSTCIPNGAHTNHCWANLVHASKCIKNSGIYEYISKPAVIHKHTLHSFQILLFLSGCLEGSHKDGEAFSFLLTSLLDRLNMSLCEVTTMMDRSNQSEVLLLLLRFFNIIMSRKRMKGDRSEVIIVYGYLQCIM